MCCEARSSIQGVEVAALAICDLEDMNGDADRARHC